MLVKGAPGDDDINQQSYTYTASNILWGIYLVIFNLKQQIESFLIVFVS